MSNLLRVIQSSVKEPLSTSDVISKLYNLITRQVSHEDAYDSESNFIGEIDTPNTYKEYVDLIKEKFPLLTINPAGLYVMFTDPEVLRILNSKIGDGTGITEEAMLACTTWTINWFKDNGTIETFNEFYKFRNVTSLPSKAFNNCTKLKEINISNIQTVESECFRFSTKLTKVIATNLTTVKSMAFREIPLSSECDFGHNLTVLEYTAFAKTNITEIDLSNVTIMGDEVFSNCTSLVDIHTDLSNVTSMGSRCFYGCEALTGDFIINTTILPAAIFYNCKNITSVDVSNCESFGIYVYGGNFENCEKIRSINLNPNVKRIGPRTFTNCTLLQTIDISHVEEFVAESNQAAHFQNCTSLRNVTLNENLEYIPLRMFFGCTSLTEMTLPASITSIGAYAFQQCYGLQKITILATTPPTLELAPGNNNANTYQFTFRYPDTYPIYVPAESVELYKTTERWSYYASRIQAIPT